MEPHSLSLNSTKKLFIISLCFILISSLVAAETEHTRTQWYRDAKFGMFIHWGVYSVYGGVYNGRDSARYGEWILNNENIPLKDYRATAKEFIPTDYDPEAWAEAALKAGVKYIVITSKHHDGFALYDTKFSDWSITKHSNWGKDLIKPLGEACRKRGIRFGLYYSHAIDWGNGGAQSERHFKAAGWKPVDYDHYLKTISLPQAREVLENYNPDILWWDMPSGMTAERAKPFNALLKEYPHVLSNSRLGGGNPGDFGTYEQSIPSAPQLDRLWESCMTMNHTWGYRSTDHHWKSTEKLLHNLIGSVSKGGNFLLNVGPDGKGNIPAASLERMAQMGEWLKDNGEAIYETGPTPFLFQQAWTGTTTQRRDGDDTLLYLHVFNWPKDGKLRVLGVKNKGCSAALLLAKNKSLELMQDDQGLVIDLPEEAPSQYSSTVVLRVPGKLTVEHDSFFMTADGVVLSGLDAAIEGPEPRRDTNNNFIERIKDQTIISWKVDVPEAGRYLLSGNVGATSDRRLDLSMAGQNLIITVPNSHVMHYSGGNFPNATLAVIEISKPGRHQLTIKPKGNWGDGIALQHLKLQPVTLTQDADGNIDLPALSAKSINATQAGIAGGSVRSPKQVQWDLMITRQAGTFTAVFDYNCDQPVEAFLECGKNRLDFTLPNAFGKNRRLQIPVGSIIIGESGLNTLTLGGKLHRLTFHGIKLFIDDQLSKHPDATTSFPFARAELWDTGHSDIERWQPQHAVDDDIKTAWQTKYKTKMPQTIEIDYGKEKSFNHIFLSTGYDESWHNIQEATLRVMTPKGWKDVTQVKEAGRSYDLDFPEVTGRLFQLEVTKCNMLHIYELQLTKK